MGGQLLVVMVAGCYYIQCPDKMSWLCVGLCEGGVGSGAVMKSSSEKSDQATVHIGLYEGGLGDGAVVKSSSEKSDPGPVTVHIGLYEGGLGSGAVVKLSSENVGVKSDLGELLFSLSHC